MKAYVEARAEGETAIRATRLERYSPTCDMARRLYPVTLKQMLAVLIAAVEEPTAGIRIVETRQIRRARLSR